MDTERFPLHRFEELGPIIMEDVNEEQYIDKILDACQHGQGYQYLIRWCGFGQEHDKWLPGSKLEDCEALDVWLASWNRSP